MMATLGVQGSALSFVFKMLTSPLATRLRCHVDRANVLVSRSYDARKPHYFSDHIVSDSCLSHIPKLGTHQNLFIDLWAGISDGASQAWAWVTTKASEAWAALQDIFAPVGQWFSNKWQEIKIAFSGGIQGVSALIINWSPIGLFYSALQQS